MILVTGSTGTVGSQVVQALVERQARFRALVRKPADAERLGGQGIETVRGDFADIGSLRAALAGAERLFLLSPPHPAQAETENRVVDAARAAGVRHIVKLSVLAAEQGLDCAFMRWSRAVEEHIEASGLAYTFLRPNGFMQNLLNDARTVIAEGALYASVGDARISLIDAADIGAVAARALTEPGHEGKAYALTGPEALAYPDIAATLSSVLGKPVAAIDLPADAARQGMLSSGMPDWLVDGLLELDRLYQSGVGALVTDTVPRLLGRPARSLKAFFEEHRSVFQG